jgi:hypothetical protein
MKKLILVSALVLSMAVVSIAQTPAAPVKKDAKAAPAKTEVVAPAKDAKAVPAKKAVKKAPAKKAEVKKAVVTPDAPKK